MSFRDDTTVRRVGDTSFEAAIEPGWDIAGNANGGYLLAIIARAITEATGKPHPVTMTAHYLAPGKVGPVVIEVESVRIGNRHATATAKMLVGDQPIIVALGTTTTLDVAPEPLLVDASPPALPSPEDCVLMRPMKPSGDHDRVPSFVDQVDLRLHPEDAGFIEGAVTGKARVRGWFRFRDDEEVDPLGLLVAVDGFPPTIFNAALPVGWTPTVELTAHVRAVPQPGWLRCSFSTRFVTGGYLEEDGEVWDASGRLIAQSRQLALVPRGGTSA
ncbi:MAG: thioesterase family protein [Acidimicrobiales bacterium]|nr:thioesterase family protein [Acidimicrobiales bacterium]